MNLEWMETHPLTGFNKLRFKKWFSDLFKKRIGMAFLYDPEGFMKSPLSLECEMVPLSCIGEQGRSTQWKQPRIPDKVSRSGSFIVVHRSYGYVA